MIKLERMFLFITRLLFFMYDAVPEEALFDSINSGYQLSSGLFFQFIGIPETEKM